MSAPSINRLKDANAGAGPKPLSAQKPSKPLTPVSISGKNPGPVLQKSSSGKENPRPSHRSFGSTRKPVLRPVPRVEKSSVDDRGGEGRVRWSTSSGPRGRSPSPSDLIRVFSDLKREKGSRLSGEKGESSSDKKVGYRNSGVKWVENEKKVRDSSCKSDRVCEETEEESKIKTSLSSDSLKASNLEATSTRGSSSSDPKTHAFPGCGDKSAGSVGKTENTGRGINSVSRRKSLDNGGKVLEILKEKRVGEGSSGYTNKYQSKLHEKLAFLEGKVKKISSDIKKTKDMLDLNNPDASKMILSNIQEKISGIEKAMGHVVSDADGKSNLPNQSSNEEKKESVNNAIVKSSVKELNNQELEDRLFPHQRLLRSRTQSKISSEDSKSHHVSDSVASSREVKVEVVPLDPTEENEIASEFLASLDREESELTIRNDGADSKNLEVKEMDVEEMSKKQCSSEQITVTSNLNEILEEFDDEENREEMEFEEIDDACMYQLNEIGTKHSTGGWFVSEGEAALLTHDDGSCSYYDIANNEVKSVYNPPNGVSPNTWRDCWMVRATGPDGCSGRYVLSASAGNTLEAGFCSWDFYTKEIKAFHVEDTPPRSSSRTVLAPLSSNGYYGGNALACSLEPEARRWWYKPCGPLIISTASSQRLVKVFDIRDGEQIMRWELRKPVATVDYSSPLQWRNRGKVAIAEAEAISVWDVNSQHPEAQLTISSSGCKISAFHINNTDGELGGGVRQRVSSSEAEGNDGVFCTKDSINVLDFRQPNGIGARILKLGINPQCVSSCGDSIFLGCTDSQVKQFSLRKQRLVSAYSLPPEPKSHSDRSDITQVWGNSSIVMAISGMGLSVFDATKDETRQQPSTGDYGNLQNVRESIGLDDMYSPSFDYSGCRVLLISRGRPALWRQLL